MPDLLALVQGASEGDDAALSAVEKAVAEGKDAGTLAVDGPSLLISAAEATSDRGGFVVERLLRAKCDACARDSKGVAPLHVAAFAGGAKSLEALLVARADVDSRDRHGQTPLFFAKNAQVAALLGRAGANANLLNHKGQSGLHLAAHGGNDEVVRWLVDQMLPGVINIQDKHGRTAAWLARRRDHISTAQMLEKYGANTKLQPHKHWHAKGNPRHFPSKTKATWGEVRVPPQLEQLEEEPGQAQREEERRRMELWASTELSLVTEGTDLTPLRRALRTAEDIGLRDADVLEAGKRRLAELAGEEFRTALRTSDPRQLAKALDLAQELGADAGLIRAGEQVLGTLRAGEALRTAYDNESTGFAEMGRALKSAKEASFDDEDLIKAAEEKLTELAASELLEAITGHDLDSLAQALQAAQEAGAGETEESLLQAGRQRLAELEQGRRRAQQGRQDSIVNDEAFANFGQHLERLWSDHGQDTSRQARETLPESLLNVVCPAGQETAKCWRQLAKVLTKASDDRWRKAWERRNDAQFDLPDSLMLLILVYTAEASPVEQLLGCDRRLPALYSSVTAAARMVAGEQQEQHDHDMSPRDKAAADVHLERWAPCVVHFAAAAFDMSDSDYQPKVVKSINDLKSNARCRPYVAGAVNSVKKGLAAWPDLLDAQDPSTGKRANSKGRKGPTSEDTKASGAPDLDAKEQQPSPPGTAPEEKIAGPCLFYGLNLSWNESGEVAQNFAALKGGQSFNIAGLRSMTLHPLIAMNFLDPGDYDGKHNVLVAVEDVRSALPLWTSSLLPWEFEVLVPCLTKCTVVCDPVPQVRLKNSPVGFLFVRLKFDQVALESAFLKQVASEATRDSALLDVRLALETATPEEFEPLKTSLESVSDIAAAANAPLVKEAHARLKELEHEMAHMRMARARAELEAAKRAAAAEDLAPLRHAIGVAKEAGVAKGSLEEAEHRLTELEKERVELASKTVISPKRGLNEMPHLGDELGHVADDEVLQVLSETLDKVKRRPVSGASSVDVAGLEMDAPLTPQVQKLLELEEEASALSKDLHNASMLYQKATEELMGIKTTVPSGEAEARSRELTAMAQMSDPGPSPGRQQWTDMRRRVNAVNKVQAMFRGQMVRKNLLARVAPAESKDGCKVWEVMLSKSDYIEDKYGLSHSLCQHEYHRALGNVNFSKAHGGPETLCVRKVDDGSLLAKWNGIHPEAQVLPFDRIVSVNTLTNIREMQHELKSTAMLLKIVRYPARFDVTLKTDSGISALGIQFEACQDTPELRVTAVVENGALEAHNQAVAAHGHYHWVVMPNFRIEAVNSAVGTSTVLAEKFAAATAAGTGGTVTLRVRRVEDPKLTAQEEQVAQLPGQVQEDRSLPPCHIFKEGEELELELVKRRSTVKQDDLSPMGRPFSPNRCSSAGSVDTSGSTAAKMAEVREMRSALGSFVGKLKDLRSVVAERFEDTTTSLTPRLPSFSDAFAKIGRPRSGSRPGSGSKPGSRGGVQASAGAEMKTRSLEVLGNAPVTDGSPADFAQARTELASLQLALDAFWRAEASVDNASSASTNTGRRTPSDLIPFKEEALAQDSMPREPLTQSAQVRRLLDLEAEGEGYLVNKGEPRRQAAPSEALSRELPPLEPLRAAGTAAEPAAAFYSFPSTLTAGGGGAAEKSDPSALTASGGGVGGKPDPSDLARRLLADYDAGRVFESPEPEPVVTREPPATSPTTKTAPPELQDCSPLARTTAELWMDDMSTTPTGTYSITWKEVPVNQGLSRHSEVVARLPMGAKVKVVEVSDALDQGRVRARIEDPAGWISLRYDKNDSIFAVKVEDSPVMPLVAAPAPTSPNEDTRTPSKRSSIGAGVQLGIRDIVEDDLLHTPPLGEPLDHQSAAGKFSPLIHPGAPPVQLPVGGAAFDDLEPVQLPSEPPPELPEEARRRSSSFIHRSSDLVPIREDAVLEGAAAIPVFALVPPAGMSPAWAEEVVVAEDADSPNVMPKSQETSTSASQSMHNAVTEAAATKIQSQFRGRTMHKRYENAKASLITKVETAQCILWDVHLVKSTANDRYGFSHTNGKDEFCKARGYSAQQVKDEDGPATLMVKQVRPDGLLHRWNQEHPDAAVLPFDRVVEVNGKPGVEEMQNELRAPSVLLRMVRYPAKFEVELTRSQADQKLGIKFEKPSTDDASASAPAPSYRSDTSSIDARRRVDELKVIGLIPQGLLEVVNKQHMGEGNYHFVVTNGMYVSGANGIASWEAVAARLKDFSTKPAGPDSFLRLSIRRNDPWVEEQQQKSEQAKKDIMLRGLRGELAPPQDTHNDNVEEV